MPTICNRPVTRETSSLVFERSVRRPIIIRIEEGGKLLRCRLKGTRRTHTVSIEAVYRLGLAATAEALRQARKAARLEKRRSAGHGARTR